jgi:hypothetical protein
MVLRVYAVNGAIDMVSKIEAGFVRSRAARASPISRPSTSGYLKEYCDPRIPQSSQDPPSPNIKIRFW